VKAAFSKYLSVAALTLSLSLPIAAQAPLLVEPPTDPVTKPATTPPTGPSAIINTAAGDGLEGAGGYGGLATNAEMYSPTAIAFDIEGNTYIADSVGQVVLKVTASTGKISVYAGTGESGYSGDNGPATKARLNQPAGVGFDPSGNLYISDTGNNVIRMVAASTGIITTYAGKDPAADAIDLLSPQGDLPPKNCDISSYDDDLLYNLCGPVDGLLRVFAGARPKTADPIHFTLPDATTSAFGTIFIDSTISTVLMIDSSTDILSTLAGDGTSGYSGDGGQAVNAELNNPSAIAVDSESNLYIADTDNCTIRMVNATTGIITSMVGSAGAYNYAICGLAGDGGPASAAQLNKPRGVAVDAAGNVFIADTGNSVVRMIAKSNGYIYTVAGSYNPSSYPGGPATPIPGYSGDGGPAGFASLTSPTGITIWQPPPTPAHDEATGPGLFETLYIADQGNHVVRSVTLPSALPSTAPVITPPGTGPYTLAATPISVTITAPVKDSVIYYTEDGSIPTTSSTKYTGQINLTNTASITAFAVVPNEENSPATIANYYNAPAPMFSPGTEAVTKPVKVTITDANPKAQIYYSTGGPNASFNTWQLYTGPITVPVDTYLQASAYVTVTDYDNNVVGAFGPTATATYTNSARPVVTTRAATLINPTYATLNASITPNSAATTYWFAYGTSSTSLLNAGEAFGLTGTASVPVSLNVTGLTGHTKYYFQAVAMGNGTTVKGAILSFTTPSAAASN
jgi:sugar lactone lactonase YvrE